MKTVKVSESVLQNYDLSCPECKSINSVRIAGAYEFRSRPEKWFCYCGRCGKSFKPRKKESGNTKPGKEGESYMPVSQRLKEKLPKETLALLIEQGYSQNQIARSYGLVQSEVSRLKKEYWPNGFIADKTQQAESENDPELEKTADNFYEYPANSTGPQPVQEPEKVDELDFENFDWAEPRRVEGLGQRDVINIQHNKVVLAAAIINKLQPGPCIKVGVKNGIIAIVRTDDKNSGYILPKKIKSTQIGGARLVNFLIEKHGVKPGEYELEEYREGCFIARAN